MKDELRDNIIKILNRQGIKGSWVYELADEILELPLYPKEFVEWIVDQFKRGIMFHSGSDNTFGFYNQDNEYTLDELYEDWKNLKK